MDACDNGSRAVLKTVAPKGVGGSNPSASAICGVSGVMVALQVVALADVVRIRTIPPTHDALAQSVEYRTFNAEVMSSSLISPTTVGTGS